MTAADVLQRARQHGVEVIPDGERLRLRAPRKPPDSVIEQLRQHQAEILAWLGSDQDRRAIVTYRLREAPHLSPVVVGAAGETHAEVIDALRRRYGDRLLHADPYRRAP